MDLAHLCTVRFPIGTSSNGKTADSGSAYRGSNPCVPAKHPRRPHLDRYLMVMLGGAFGSLARYLLAGAIMARTGTRFPLGTVVVNITGSFLIGLLMTLLTERLDPHPYWR